METLEQYMARREATRAELTGTDGDNDILVQDALGRLAPAAAPRASMLVSSGCLSHRQAE